MINNNHKILQRLVHFYILLITVSLFKKQQFFDIVHEHLSFGIYTSCTYDNEKYNIINVHLDDSQKLTRIKQIKMLKINDDEKYIIGGDFNEPYCKNNLSSDNTLYNILSCDVNNMKPTYNMHFEKEINDNILTKNILCDKVRTPLVPDDVNDIFTEFGSDHVYVILSVE